MSPKELHTILRVMAVGLLVAVLSMGLVKHFEQDINKFFKSTTNIELHK